MAGPLTEAKMIERMERAVARMSRRRRAIFLAVRLGGTSYEEIAERTGLTVRQVERHVARAIAQIDRALDGRRPERGWRRLFRLLAGGWRP